MELIPDQRAHQSPEILPCQQRVGKVIKPHPEGLQMSHDRGENHFPLGIVLHLDAWCIEVSRCHPEMKSLDD